jgi:hypothetical protein
MHKTACSFRLSESSIATLKKHKELGNFKTETEALEDILLHLNQPQPITSDVPMGMPPNPEKQKALEQLKQEHYEVTELPLPPCNYAAKGRIDNKLGYQLIICNDPKKYKKPTEIPLQACQNCWKRKEWGKEKREREQEENPIHTDPDEDLEQETQVPNCSNRNLHYKGAENDPQAIHDFGEKGGKKIYCMQFGDWKTLEFCIDCFKGRKPTLIQSDISEIESTDIGEPDF